MATDIGKTLDATRKLLGMSLESFAKYLGKPPHFKDTLSRLITKDRVPTPGMVEAIAQRLEKDERTAVAAQGPALRAALKTDATRRGRDIGARLATPPARPLWTDAERAAWAPPPPGDPPAITKALETIGGLLRKHPDITGKVVMMATAFAEDEEVRKGREGKG